MMNASLSPRTTTTTTTATTTRQRPTSYKQTLPSLPQLPPQLSHSTPYSHASLDDVTYPPYRDDLVRT
jgi:hypothetical protein